MRLRLSPFILTVAALALATVASAQDRGRDRDSRGDRPSRSRAERGDSRHGSDRGDRSRSDRDETRADDRRSSDRGDSRPPQGFPSRDDRRSGDGDRSSRDPRSGGPSRGDDRRDPFNRGDREYGDRSGRGDDGRNGARPPVGAPSRGFGGVPTRYDGRGYSRPARFGTPPIHAALNVQVRHTEFRDRTTVAIGAQFGGLRVGYTSYGGGGYSRGYGRPYGGPRAGFGFGYYAYDPYAPDVVVVASPWYRYSYLPPYIDQTRVVVVNDYPSRWQWDGWRDYDWQNDRRDEAVQDSLDDLREAFEQNSERIADRLVPESGNVAIYNDGHYDYSLNPDDFQKMFLDGVEQSKTIRYEIQEVRRRGDEVRVRARHSYEDSWGQEQSVVHTITLRREFGGDYVIREFGSE